MYNKKPPFEITNEILDSITEIAELVGNVNATQGLSTNPTLRRSNRIRTIYSSLAIEQNTLSLEQVTAVLNGKHIFMLL
jgi:Fic family protein